MTNKKSVMIPLHVVIFILVAFCIIIGIFAYLTFQKPNTLSLRSDVKQQTVLPSPRALSTGCEFPAAVFDAALLHSPDWKATPRNPNGNETLEGLFTMIAEAPGKPLVGYNSNRVRLMSLTKTSIALIEKPFQNQFERDALPKMVKNGYTLIGQDSSAYQKQINQNAPHIPLALDYIFLRDNELFAVNLHSEDGNTGDITYTCASDISFERNAYKTILTYPGFDKKYVDSLQIWDIKDNVYVVNIFGKGSLSGHAEYISVIEGKWVRLFVGQDNPPCENFEKYKVGKGLTCYRPNSFKENTVTY